MIENYLKGAWRNITRERTNSLINIIGLTLGITGSLILFLFIRDSTSYDTYHSKHDRIYRVVSKSIGNHGDAFTQGVPSVMPEAFAADFQEAEVVAITSHRGGILSIAQDDGEFKKYREDNGIVYTEPSFFNIFDRGMLFGSAAGSLDEPNEAIISKKWAVQYFQRDDARGEIVKFDGVEYKITAVMDDYPVNTDLPFNLMLSYSTVRKSMDARSWGNISDSENCYFLLKENESIASINDRLPAFADKYYGAGDENTEHKAFLIQPLSDLHTDTRFGNYNKHIATEALIAFAVIGFFLLLTCCINFVNLTTAAAVKRTKEVGVRKSLGSSRRQLISQLLSESMVVTVIAVLISVALTQVLLGFLNPFMELSLTLSGGEKGVWIFLVAIVAVVTVLSGLYPALVVSGYKPAMALKGQVAHSSSGLTVRRTLVVLQFFISQVFIIVTIIIIQQMDFMRSQDMGFAKDAIVTIPVPDVSSTDSTGNHKRLLKNEILRIPGVEQASLNSAPPFSPITMFTSFTMAGKTDVINTQMKKTDRDYITIYQLNLVAGTLLDDLDTMNRVVVNEMLVRRAGFASSADIIGKQIDLWDNMLTVVGVVKDFNANSLEKAIEPLILMNDLGGYKSLSVKLNAQDVQAVLGQLQATWERAYPEEMFSYEFVDESVKRLYRGQYSTKILLNLFSGVAILIGCLGLFGLVTFMANQKTKEIGVRKVLGASVESILLLFSKEFTKLILIAFALAAPITGFAMHKILEKFAYKIDIGPMIFVTGIVITFLIAFLTVGFRSLKAALVNPVDSLRSE